SKQAVKSGVNALGVVLAEDGIRLRKAGIRVPLYLLGEPPVEIVRDAIKYDFTLGLNSFEKAQVISRICEKFGKKITVHVKVDTGMNRIGINFKKAADEIEKIVELKGLSVKGIFTHFSCAGEEDESYTRLQWQRFQDVLRQLELKKIKFQTVHCANSAAFLRYRDFHLDMVRLGISIYGLSPFGIDSQKWLEPEILSILSQLKPVLCLKSKVSFIKTVSSGESISYGATFKTTRRSVIATIPLGYADGYSRLFSNKAGVLINGGLAPVVGNVTMDQIMVDVTDIEGNEKIKEGTEVTLIGNSGNKKVTADYLADIIGTINYEVCCACLRTGFPGYTFTEDGNGEGQAAYNAFKEAFKILCQ
ncbi:MAG: alanine racemase, partial [Actinobacteria bacterium]|nr:alanine racemase [Actinomycetota bacterium]